MKTTLSADQHSDSDAGTITTARRPAPQRRAGRPGRPWLAFTEVDRQLLALRWVTLAAVALLASVSAVDVPQWSVMFGTLIVLNVLLSVHGARRRPFASRQPVGVIAIDALQATAATLLGGGAYSPFFPLFILLVVELAVAAPAPRGFAWVLTAGAMHVGAALIGQHGAWTVLAAYMTVGKLIVIVIVGTAAVALSGQVRREERSRVLAEEHASQVAILNELFFEFGQPRSDLGEAIAALLSGAQRLLDADAALVVLCDPALGCWRVHGAGQECRKLDEEIDLADWGWQTDVDETFVAGPAYGRALPTQWPDPRSQVVAGVRLSTPALTVPGALVIGRDGAPLDRAAWLLLRTLAHEAELSLRNAELHAAEHAQLAQLRQFDEVRQSFFSAVAHELRTPVTVLKTLLPTIEDWPRLPADRRHEAAQVVDQNLERLESLITEILESSELEAGAVVLRREPIDLQERVRRALDDLAPLFESKRQRSELEVAAPMPFVDADRRRLDQVLSSLLHNAFKFVPRRGRIRVLVTRDGSFVRTCVEDDGPGVPTPARAHLFEKFHALPGSNTAAGVGLGLYVSRELVALHGGALWYEARPGGGSRFCFTLPITEESDADGITKDPGH